MESFLQTSGIIFLAGVLLLWAYSFYRGRKIVELMRRRYRTKWEELGCPKPDYLSSLNLQKWSAFLNRREYHSFNDRVLNSMCDDQRKLERVTLIMTVTFFVLFGGIAVWQKYTS